MNTLVRFVGSKAGWSLVIYLTLAGVISAAVASYFYNTSLQSFLAQKTAEKANALQLVDAFVTTYSRFRSQFGQDAPVPATFRAHSIESFNKQLGSNSAFSLRWVGRQGRQIATPPVDAEMARTIEELAVTADRSPRSALATIDNQQILRTIYPSLANEQSCVNCHNQLQPDKTQWRLNDVMGAFAIDVPVAASIPRDYIARDDLRMEAYRRLAAVMLHSDVDDVAAEWADRYGPPPPPAAALLAVGRVRAECVRLGISDIAVQKGSVRLFPLMLRESQKLRLRRLAPKALVKSNDEIVLPLAARGAVGSKQDGLKVVEGLLMMLGELVPVGQEAATMASLKT